MARPTKYLPEFAEQARKLCLLGATDKELADFFQISTGTLHNWKNEYPEFLSSLKEGKDLADAVVAEKLFKRATGYEHKAVKIVADAKTKDEHIVEYTERYPPDTTACIFWLKNRQRDKWRDKVETEHSGNIGLVDFLSELPDPK
jgi:transposase-like protein